MKNLRRVLLFSALFLLTLTQIVTADTSGAAVSAADAVSARQLLEQQQFVIWQKINQARKDPRAIIEQLGLTEEQVRNALGFQNTAFLDTGLPPLAWNDRLGSAAYDHGRDMLDRLYYNHVSLEGVTPAERVRRAGYDALNETERLGILAFYNIVEIQQGVDIFLNNLMRDELTAAPGVELSVFSPNVSEVGVALFAETLTRFDNQPYVFLLVADFAKPLQPRNFLIVEASADVTVWWLNYTTMEWHPLEQFGNFWQAAYPAAGTWLVAYDQQGVLMRWAGMAPAYRSNRNTAYAVK